jgi:HEAT repeat protein
MSTPTLRVLAIASALSLAAAPFVAAQADDTPSKMLASKDVKDRLMGIFTIMRDKNEPRAEELLLNALHDPDWEVIEEAATALATFGTSKSVDTLVDVALDATALRIRLAAARALAKIAPDEAAEKITARLKGEDAAQQLEVLAIVGGTTALATLDRLQTSKKPETKHAARIALGDLGGPANFDDFAKMLTDADLLVRIAGARGLGRLGDDRSIDLLLKRLETQQLSDVEERRIRFALVATVANRPAAERAAAADALLGKLASVTTRHVRLMHDLATHPETKDARDACAKRVAGLVTSNVSDIRAAAVKSLGIIGTSDHAAKIGEVARNDAEQRVRLHALRAYVAIAGANAGAVVAEAIEKEVNPDAREDAAALAGIHTLKGTETALRGALTASEWPVVLAAAISLGKLRCTEARGELAKLLDHKEWRLRGAGALGLAGLRDAAATELLIAKMSDKDPSVRATIEHALARITGESNLKNKAQWDAWWKKNKATIRFVDPKRDAEQAAADGYSPATAYQIYSDLDVIVIKAPRAGGDHIEDLLKRYKIAHRLATAQKVDAAELHPFAITVSNCSGEIAPADIDRVQWFVRAGGYLFASCWSLTETVGKAFPNIAKMHQTPTQVMDEVRAEALSNDGLMKGVLRPATRTRYVLEGSHVISPIDKERFEVLIDSPECAARWGEGNLAGWYTMGHGLVFDSANHFDLQGMKRAVPKTPKERRAMAMDVLGYSHPEIRDLEKKAVFMSEKKCSDELEDLSMFRLVTNFVTKKKHSDL